MLRARNEERRQIARELHDTTAQLLLELDFALKLLHDTHALPPGIDARHVVVRLQEQMRCLSYILHPPELEKYGLVGALEALTLGMSARTGIAMSFKAVGYREGLLPEMELAVLRIAQEALMNVFKHSKSDRAEVRLHCTCNWLCLRVRDFGVGLGAKDAIEGSLGVGLRSMTERMENVGGKIRISLFERGTAVSAFVKNPLGTCPEVNCAVACRGPGEWPIKAR
ncbi:sensor histidine kinase [Novosphingobium soli]|uniref:sensor histidine kinase n=1 Tax=Novosphingobium soli TaxID=574956 RepID=UPI0036D3D469